MKIIFSLLIIINLLLSFQVFSQTTGALDPTFEVDGIVMTNVAGSDYIRDMTVQTDGKIVVVGDCNSNRDIFVMRYNYDGTLDTDFDTDGKKTFSFNGGTGDEYGRTVAIQSDGCIVIAGGYNNGTDMDVFVVRMFSDGALDPSFDSDGILQFAVGTGNDIAFDMLIQDDNKIVIGGQTINEGYNDFFVTRLWHFDGSFDAGFNSGIPVVTTISGDHDYLYKIGILSTDVIIATGYTYTGMYHDVSMAAYNTDGSLYTGFNGSGIKMFGISSGSDYARGMVIQPDDKIVVTGSAYYGDNRMIAARVNPNGSLDGGFGSGGMFIANNGEYIENVFIQPDGKLVFTGDDFNDYIVIRYNSNGTRDNTFGSSGKVTTALTGSSDISLAGLFYNWRIYNAGSAYNGAYEAAITRHYACVEPHFTTQPVDVTICEGKSTSFTSVAAGSTPIAYQWYDNYNNPIGGNSMVLNLTSITAMQAGDYYCIATNLCGKDTCDLVTLTVNSAPLAYAGEDATLCSGSEVTLTATGGDTYTWNNSIQQGIPFYPTSTLTYTVTVTTTSTGCTATDNIILSITPLPSANAGNDQIECSGYEVTLNATGGDNYEWSNGVFQNTPFTPSATTTYTVTVTNMSTFCTKTDQVTVSLIPSPDANAGTDKTVCENTMVTLTATASGGVTPYNYSWSGGIQQGVPFSATAQNEYYVTVTGSNNCKDIDTILVNVNMLPSGDAGDDQTICNGQTVTIQATGGDSYYWSTGSGNSIINETPSATQSYYVSVYSPEGCLDKDTVVVFVDQVPVVNAGSNQTLCANNASASLSGSVTNAGGGLWSLVSGDGYFVDESLLNTTFVADPSGGTVVLSLASTGNGACNEATDNITISFTPAPVVSAGSDVSLCSSVLPYTLNGSVTVAAGGTWTGGAGTFTPSANAVNAQYMPTATEISNGYVTLTLTSTDNGTCNAESDQVSISITSAPVVSAGTDHDVCAGSPSVTLQGDVQNAIGGIWTGGGGSFDPDNTSMNAIYLPSLSEITNGTATLTLTSTGNGNCSPVADQVIIDIHSEPSVSVTDYTEVLCYGVCSGTAEVTGNGGTAPYDYLWSFSAGNASTDAVINLCSGAHQVTLTDFYGCEATTEVTLSQPDQLSITVAGIVNNNCWGGHTGVVNTTVIGGTDPYSFIWSNGATTANAAGLAAGTYSVTVIDFNGCFAYVNNIQVTQQQKIQIYINTTNAMCNQTDGSATATVTGGSSPFGYLWSDGQTLNPAIDLAAGSYSVIVTDNFGCISTKFFSVSNSGGFTVSEVIDDVTCSGGSDGAVDITISGGTAPFGFEWSNGETTEDISSLSPGAYDLIVTDNVGCMWMETFEVEAGNNLSFTSSTTVPSCSQADGAITVTPTGGIAPYAYNWSNGGNAANITSLTAGNYLFTITDNAGCSVESQISLPNTGGPVIAIDTIISATCGGLGSLYINVTGGTPSYSYSWSDLSTSEDIINVAPGQYNVTVNDGGGCVTVDEFVIPSIQLPVQPICIVTVDTSAGRNMIVWERVVATGIDYFKIYRETSIPDQYQCIANIDADSLSEYVDLSANPFVRSFRYKMSAVDACGSESPLSEYHKTLHLTMNQGIGQSYNLIWDDYEGFTYYSFIVMRYLPSTGWVNLDTLPKTLHSYTDAPPSTSGIRYLIKVDSPLACVSSTPSKEIGGPYSSSYSNMEDEGLMVGNNLSELLYNLQLSPNPATNKTMIKTAGIGSGICKLSITNVTGQSVYNANVDSGSDIVIDLAGYSKGVYFVELTADRVYRGKLVIE